MSNDTRPTAESQPTAPVPDVSMAGVSGGHMDQIDKMMGLRPSPVREMQKILAALNNNCCPDCGIPFDATDTCPRCGTARRTFAMRANDLLQKSANE